MRPYLEGSLIVRLFMYLYKVYLASTTNKAVQTVKHWCTNSFVNKCILRYLEKNPTAEYTLSFRFLKAIGKKLDIIIRKVHFLFANSFGASITSSIYGSLKKETNSSLNKLFITFSVPFLLGYGLINTVQGTWNSVELAKAAALIIIIFFAALSINNWKLWLKNSALYKLCQYILE